MAHGLRPFEECRGYAAVCLGVHSPLCPVAALGALKASTLCWMRSDQSRIVVMLEV